MNLSDRQAADAGARVAAMSRQSQPANVSPAWMKLAQAMPENGGWESLDYKLRLMLRDDFPRLLWQHNSDSRRAHAGFPDWVLVGPSGVLYRELKREGKNPTPKQREWLDALTAAGQDAGVWRPSDYYSGRIARELAALAGLRAMAGGVK